MILEIIELFLLFIVPVLLIYYEIIPFKYRRTTLIAVSSVIIALIIIERFTLKQLGIRFDNIKELAIPYLIFTLVGLIVLLILIKIYKRKPERSTTKKYHLMYGFIVVSILQELAYRGFLFPKLQQIFTGRTEYILIILVNALLFMFIHIIYSNDIASIIMMFVSGIFFAGMYWFYPNLLLIIITHTILNYIAVLYNFFHEERKTIKRVIF